MNNSPLDIYAEKHTTEMSKILDDLYRETHLKVLNPRMISGKMQGTLLKYFSTMLRPANILEIGTFTGYSTICLAQGLTENGKIFTIDNNPEIKHISDKYFTQAKLDHKIISYTGNAKEMIPQIISSLDSLLDMVFIDADKANYLNYYNLVFDHVRKDGFIIADNALWNGKVINQTIDPNDKDTLGVIELNEFVNNDPRVDNLLLNYRDGLLIARKL